MRETTNSIIESHIIISLKRGKESAFQTVFEAHHHRLYVFCMKLLKNEVLAEEIVQDTFLSLWLNREKIKVELPIEPYLYTIARRLTLNALRHVANSRLVINRLQNEASEMHNETEESVLLNDLERFTEEAMSKLSSQQQLIFRLSRYENLNHIEIAERLEISKNTVKNHLVAALKKLRQHFDQSDNQYLIIIIIYLL